MHPTLSLYRQIVSAAKRFPSKNRSKVLAEIRHEFRRNATLGPDEAGPKIQLAHDSLRQLRAYVDLDYKASSWNIKLHQQPMPVPDRRRE
eukprot:CAMPEP_0197389704 /NCGR_PEP_ID=MMETSP1165-20131217/1889_1 /TAXON_ID=284809 /ORGANISM="Chrysocystis fragilis, Strain CCMP3189" /LENGTH=89 /DNA_ID=CAMNT_0042915133 /DNA_START=29 /DNA_END=298 /DNA_ORIENTATION=-